MFEKVLIANRGEIALRVARTCKRMGIKAVGIYSEADAESLHVQGMDEAHLVGPAPVQASYLQAEKIIAIAKSTGAQAVHPGYGLLSENSAFARAVTEAGLVFIGPTGSTLEALGNKFQARLLAKKVGVKTLPGSTSVITDVDQAQREAASLGWPILVKASMGGGGIGMKVAHDAGELQAAMRNATERAARAFGNAEIYLERYLSRPRHIEVQIIADTHGQIMALGERECSIQRRHQKLIEESPSPLLTSYRRGDALRDAMFDAAITLMREAGYVGVGTCEFLVDSDNHFYFLEVNARLQVEHAVTEACTELDLVEWQLRVACGETLEESVLRKVPSGHAIEARICAEDPKRQFLPAPGKIENLRWPPGPLGKVRIETSVQAGSEISPYYDSLIAKVITYGATRHEAVLLLDRTLAETCIEPLTTNIEFLRQVLNDESFRAGQYDITFADALLARL